MFLTKNFQLVECIVAAAVTANQDIYFQNQPQLQSISGDKRVYVKMLETFSVKAIAKSPLTAGANVATQADLQNAVITLNEKGTENKKYIPLTRLNNIFSETGANFVPSSWVPLLFKDVFEIDWTKSYITMLAAPSGAISFLFGVHYDYMPIQEYQQ